MTQRILVVDDDLVTRLMVRHVLEQLGHPVDLAVDVSQAARALGEVRYAAVFCDLRLPDGTGLDLVEVLAGLDARPVFVMVTGTSEEQGVQDARIAAVDAFLTKPVSSTDLDDVLRAVLAAR